MFVWTKWKWITKHVNEDTILALIITVCGMKFLRTCDSKPWIGKFYANGNDYKITYYPLYLYWGSQDIFECVTIYSIFLLAYNIFLYRKYDINKTECFTIDWNEVNWLWGELSDFWYVFENLYGKLNKRCVFWLKAMNVNPRKSKVMF